MIVYEDNDRVTLNFRSEFFNKNAYQVSSSTPSTIEGDYGWGWVYAKQPEASNGYPEFDLIPHH